MIGKRLVSFCYFLHTFSDVFCSLTNPLPQNKAVLKGSTRIGFDCSSTNGGGAIGWSFMPVGSDATSIANGNTVFLGYKDAYEISLSGDQTNTLIIKTVNESLAGIYFCNEGVNVFSSQLIVYNSDPECTSNASSVQQLYQGQSVQMSCSFSYTANSTFVKANMVWTRGTPPSPVANSTPVITTTGTLLTRAVSTIFQIVGYSSPFPTYQCQTSFRVTGNNATNVPTYSYNKSFDSVTVFYFNPNCSIIGANSGDSIYVGTSIICKADANPPPTYRWSDGTNSTLSDTSTVQISSDGNYRCTARNSVSSCQLSINLTTYTTTVPPTTTTPTTTAPPPTSPTSKVPSESPSSASESAAIIVGVVVGVVVSILLIIVVVVVCCCIRKKRAEEKLKKKSNPSQQRDQGSTERRNEEQTNNINGNYEMMRNRSEEQPQIYCQLRPLEPENHEYYNISNEI